MRFVKYGSNSGGKMDRLLQDIVTWIKKENKSIVIGISGHGAAGKTTFANRLINLLNHGDVSYINTDPYIVSSDMRKHTIINYTYRNEQHHFKMTACHPAAHHLPSLERDIQMVRKGLNLLTIDTHYMKSALISSKNKVTIVEGMAVAFIDPQLFDLKVYFYTDSDTEMKRRSGRDVVERGADINYLKQSHEERRIQYELFMHSYRKHFDIIFKASDGVVSLEKNSFEFNDS